MVHLSESFGILHRFSIPPIYLFMRINIYIHGFMNVYLYFVLQSYTVLFCSSNCYKIGYLELFQLASMSPILLTWPIILFVFVYFFKLLFWHYKMLQSHLVYFLFKSESQQFLQGTWFFLVEIRIRKQDLRTTCYCCIVASVFSQLTEWENRCMYSNPCIFIRL